MTHLLILCEGHLEKRILEKFLKFYWQKRFKTVEVQRYSGNGELATKFKADTETQLTAEPTSSVLCLVDLYKEPFGQYQTDLSLEENFVLIQAYMYKQIQSRFHPRFGAFPVVMELETWLLADPDLQTKFQRNYPQPEAIRHPSRELEIIYEGRNGLYDKIESGVDLFGQVDVEKIYNDTCPHFILMIDWLKLPSPDKRKEELSSKIRTMEKECEAKYQLYLTLYDTARTEEDLDRLIEAEVAYEACYDNLSKLKF